MHFDIHKTALIAVDLQKSMLPGNSWAVADHETVLSNARVAIESSREAGIPIIYVTYVLDPGGADKMKYEPEDEQGRPLHSVAGAVETEICDEIKPEAGDIIIPKQRFTAWYGSKLDVVLRRLGIEHLILFGVWTEACLKTTVYDAIWRDYRVTLVKDACGTVMPDMHKVAVLDMANWLYGGFILNAGELQKALNGDDYPVWRFKKPGAFQYSLETVHSLYESLDQLLPWSTIREKNVTS